MAEVATLRDICRPSPRCDGAFSAREYFKDAPWLNIPEHRRGEILIEPLYPRGRLLGGSPSQKQQKPVSKIAALTAARKKKANEGAKSIPQRSSTSVLLLDKLSSRTPSSTSTDRALSVAGTESIGEEQGVKSQVTVDPSQKDEGQISDSNSAMHRPMGVLKPLSSAYGLSPPMPIVAPVAAPSNFAQVLFGGSVFWHKQPPVARFQPYYMLRQRPTIANLEAFAGPSPDDVVLKAQNSKGDLLCIINVRVIAKHSVGTKPSKPTKTSNDNKPLNGATQKLNDLVINDGPKAKSKNLDVLAEFGTSNSKNTANFVVIGKDDPGGLRGY